MLKQTSPNVEVETLFTCPLCEADSKRMFEVHGYPVRDCASCRHRFCELTPETDHASEVYGDSYFDGGGAGYSDYLSEADLLRKHGQRYGKLLKKFTEPGRVLDVGAAAGFVLQGLTDRGWNGIGLEPNAGMVTHGREELGLDLQVGTLEDWNTEERFDLVTMIQVVAHFTNPRQAFQQAARVTKPGGHWLVETWNRRSVTAKLLGKRWHEYSPPSVLHWFDPASLTTLAARYEMTPVKHGRPSKWIQGSHAKSLVRYKLGTGILGRIGYAPFSLIPDRLSLPYPAEDLCWMLFRKSD